MSKENFLMDDVWDRIEEEICRQNRSKLSISKQCGFDRKILYRNSHRSIHLPYFARLCIVLNVSADYLLFGEKKGN